MWKQHKDIQGFIRHMRTFFFLIALYREPVALITYVCVCSHKSTMTVWHHCSQGDAALKLHYKHWTAHSSVSDRSVPLCLGLQIFF